jgi:NADH-quinone oxidoreductase subunit L
MFRLMGLTFWGGFRGPREVWERVHESPAVMVVPLVLLAIPAALLGIVLGLPLGDATITQWLEPVFHEAEVVLGHEVGSYQLFGLDGVLILVSIAVATLGMALAWQLFGVRWLIFRRDPQPERVAGLTARNDLSRRLYRGSLGKWYFDDLNDLLFVRFGGAVADAVVWFDVHVIDGAVNGVAALTQSAGRQIRQVQTGRVQNYALGIALGLIVVASAFIVVATR